MTLILKEPIITISFRGIVYKGLNIKEQYIAQYMRGAYITLVSQLEASFDLSFAT